MIDMELYMGTRMLDKLKRYHPGLSGHYLSLASATMDECSDGEYVRVEDVQRMLDAMKADSDEPVGNGGERELDGEWLEDVEWLEEAGFAVDQGMETGDRVWKKKMATDIYLLVSTSGSTTLVWECFDPVGKRALHFGIDDNATRGDIRRLCECLGSSIDN